MRNLFQPSTFDQYRGESKFVFRGVTYERKELLGEGTTAAVYRFEPEPVNSVVAPPVVAVKIERPVKYRSVYRFEGGTSFSVDAYWNERIYGLGVLSGDPRTVLRQHYLLMPYFAGVLARDFLPNNARELIEWFILVATFVHEKMHLEHGAIHGDIKVDNVIFQLTEKKVCVIDFGLTEKIGEKTGRYAPPMKCDPILGVKKLSPNDVCPQTAPELFGQELVPAEPLQDAYGLGQFLSSLLKKTSYVSPEEMVKIGFVIMNLRVHVPKERYSIPAAISKLHNDFVATVSRSLPDINRLALFRKRRAASYQGANQSVVSETTFPPLLTKAMANEQLHLAKRSS